MQTYRRVGALGNEILAQLLVLVGKTIVQACVALVVLVVDVAGAPQQLLCQHENKLVAVAAVLVLGIPSATHTHTHIHTHTHTAAAP